MNAQRTGRKMLIGLSVLFCIQGISWMFFGAFDPFGLHDQLMADTFYGGTIPPEIDAFKRFILIPFGATDAAFFFLFGAIAFKGLCQDDHDYWWRILVASITLWFSFDSIGCAIIGAWFNIAIVNVPCLLFLAVPFFLSRPRN